MKSLSVIQLAEPCAKSWDAMTGDNRRRFCDECALSVVNLSDMTSAGAERFLSDRPAGRVCAHMTIDRGRLVSRDGAIGKWAAMVVVGLGLAGAASVGAEPLAQRLGDVAIAGKIAPMAYAYSPIDPLDCEQPRLETIDPTDAIAATLGRERPGGLQLLGVRPGVFPSGHTNAHCTAYELGTSGPGTVGGEETVRAVAFRVYPGYTPTPDAPLKLKLLTLGETTWAVWAEAHVDVTAIEHALAAN